MHKLITSLLLFLSLMPTLWDSPTLAQTNECGNGLAWQFVVDDIGQVHSDADRSVRIYDAPVGQAIDRLIPGTSFTIIDDPECSDDGRSWWQIETSDGISGWVFEGANDIYLIEPATAEVDTCADTPVPNLEVGKFARIDGRTQQLWRIGDEFESADNPLNINGDVLIVESQRCIDGIYYWRIPRPADAEFNIKEVWLAETNGNNYILLQTNNVPEISAGLFLTEYTLDPKPTEAGAPVIDVQAQVSFAQGAGGGGGTFSVGCEELRVSIQQETAGCFYVALPPIINTVTVNYIDPHGDLFKSIDYQYDRPPNGPTRNVEFVPPVGLDNEVGVWIVEVVSPRITRQYAYTLERLEISYPRIISVCEDFSPALKLIGFNPNTSAKISAIQSETEGNITEYTQILDWEFDLSSDGAALLNIDFAVGNPEDMNLIVDDGENRLGTAYFTPCVTPITETVAYSTPLEINSVVFGGGELGKVFYYAFSGNAGDVINLHLIAGNDKFDPLLQLYAPDNTLLIENDDAEVPIYGELDATIQDFELPSDGIYLIGVTTIDDAQNFTYILTLEN